MFNTRPKHKGALNCLMDGGVGVSNTCTTMSAPFFSLFFFSTVYYYFFFQLLSANLFFSLIKHTFPITKHIFNLSQLLLFSVIPFFSPRFLQQIFTPFYFSYTNCLVTKFLLISITPAQKESHFS